MTILAADNWCVKVEGKVFGPYTFHQLVRFSKQGRLASWSLIAPAGGRDWRKAGNDPRLAKFLNAAAENNSAEGFGRRDASAASKSSKQDPAQAELREAEATAKAAIAKKTSKVTPITSGAPRRAPSVHGPRPSFQDAPTGEANFVVIFDVVNAAASRVEHAVRSLGSAFRITENVWSVSCSAMTAIGVRNAVAPFLRPNELVFVIDATNGKSTWQNFGPEIHAKITEAYMKSKVAAKA